MFKRFFITLFLLSMIQVCQAQNGRFDASTNKTEVSVGETFEVSFTLDDQGKSFTAPDFKGLQVLSGPNVSTSMSIINGNMSQSNTYTFYLSADKEGLYVIKPATIKVGSKTLVSNSITIKVVKGATANPKGSSGSNASGTNRTATSRTSNLAKDLFIKAVIDKTDAYQGEQLIISYKLYTKVSLVDNSLDKFPDFNGFWSQDIKSPSQSAQFKEEIYKGEAYKVAVIKQAILFPEHSGQIKIEPMEMTFTVREALPQKQVIDPFGDPFGDPFSTPYRDFKYTVKSEAVTVNVKPLPIQGKTQGFTGAVGNFSIHVILDKKKVRANEALNYIVTLSGNGNLKLLKEPEIIFPSEFEKFDPKITDSITVGVTGVKGNRKFSYLIIPRREGNYSLNPTKFSYFDPVIGKYYTLTTPQFSIEVEKGLASNTPTVYTPTEKQDIKILDKDLRYIKSGDPFLVKKNHSFFGSFSYYMLLALGPLAFLAGLFYKRKREEALRDGVKTKSRLANKLATRHLMNAEKQLTLGNKSLFYEDLSKGLYGYLSDKLNIPLASLNQEKIRSTLTTRLYQPEIIENLSSTLNLCEMARYAPVSNVSEKDILDKAKKIIQEIESQT